MKLFPRRLHFQLTPLLDLLLIVIFAQYLEVRQSAAQAEAEANVRADEVEVTLSRRLDAERRRANLASRQAADLRSEHTELAEKLRQREHELTAALERALKQQQQVGDLVAELFQLPEDLVKQSLEPRNPAEAVRSAEEIERLRQSFQQLARERGRHVLRHFLKFEEMRKRCDLWEIYVAENGMIRFEAGDDSYEFRAGSADEFSRQLFAIYKTLPDLKRMVIILFSYGEAKRVIRRAVQQGLPLATARMQEDTGGQTRFEYADLGFSPQGPTTVDAN